MPRWEQRHRAPAIAMPDWSPDAPDRVVYESTESGVWQVHCIGPGLRRAAPGHRSPGRRRRRVRLRGWRRRPVVAGRDGRRVRPVVRGPVRRRRRQAVPGRHPARLERRVRTGARRRGRLGERSRRVRDLRLGRRRTGERDTAKHRLAAGVGTGGCVLQPGRPLGGRNAAVSAALRGRRHAAPGAARHRPSDRRYRRRPPRRGQESVDRGLVAGRGRRAARGDPRARRRGRDRDLGARDRHLDRSPDRPARRGGGARLVAGRVRAAPGEPRRGPAPPLPVRRRDGRYHADRASGRTDLRRTRPSRRHGVVPLGERRQRAARPERSRRRGAARRGRTRGGRPPVRLVPVRQRARTVGARLLRDAGGRGTVPGLHPAARRSDLVGRGSMEPRGAGLRRRRVRRGDDQLPRVDRVRGGVARRVDRRHRRPGAGGPERGSRVAGRSTASPTRRALSSAAGRGADTSR